MTTLVQAFVAMGATALVAPAVLVLLRRGHVIDYPSERSSHAAPLPRGGGLAPAAGALVALAVTPSIPGRHLRAILLVSTVFALVGLLEDVVGIRPLRRLALQFAAAVSVGPLLLDHLTGPGLWEGAFAVGVVVWLVAFVNAYNFMDGIDGISVAQAVGAGAVWFVVGTHTHVHVVSAGGAVIAGAALGFAPYNLPHARMFLGDVGSYFIGAWLATVAILGLRAGVSPEAVLAPLALYLADTGVTLVRRLAHGERWYLPHHSHAYQRLVEEGWSHVRTATFVGGCILACGALGAVSLGHSLLARVAADTGLAVVVGGYLLVPQWVARRSPAVAVA